MKYLTRQGLLLITGLLSSCAAIGGQQTVDRLSELAVNYTIIDNQAGAHGVDCAALGADWAACNRAVITLTNRREPVVAKNWAIYFSSIRRVLRVDNDQFKITRIMGDLHKLEPTDKFTGFGAHQAVSIPIINEYWQLSVSDILPRWYVTSGQAKPEVIAATNTEDVTPWVSPITGDNWKRTVADNNVLMTTAARYAKNSAVMPMGRQSLRGQIIPTPRQVTVLPQDIDLSGGVALALTGLEPATAEVIAQRFELLGVNTAGRYSIKTQITPRLFNGERAVPGAYRLAITSAGASIEGYDSAGVFYGLQSLLSLVPGEGFPVIAALRAEDAPRFQYRGMFIDVGRNFHSKAVILRALDQMAAYKLNKFHLHLTDDEGWRLAIPGLPELTDVGSKRCHDLNEQRCLLPQLGSGPDTSTHGSGYFTRADYIAILQYARARHIEVIPEVDMPAHARAAVIAMEARYQRLMKAGDPVGAVYYRLLDPTDTSNTTGVQFYDRTGYLNPCLTSSRRFVAKVIAEIQQMHREAGVALNTWHVGGDEAKNIYLGSGFSDIHAPRPDTGRIDLARQNTPWERSAACQALIKAGKVSSLDHLTSQFAIEVSKLVAAHGINKMQAWQDGLKEAGSAVDFATRRVGVNFWDTLYGGGTESASALADKGYEVTLSNPDYLYFDFPYEVNPREPGYYWGTRFSDERKVFSFAPDNLAQNAETSVDRDGNTFAATASLSCTAGYGLSAQVWSEVVRTDQRLEYQMFPRLLSVAERAWHQASWEQPCQPGRHYQGGVTHYVDKSALEQDWWRFANLLGQRELAKMDKSGVGYRLPVPGATIAGDQLAANISLPGLAIQYSVDGGKQWQDYQPAVRVPANANVWVRSVSPDGQRTSRAEPVARDPGA